MCPVGGHYDRGAKLFVPAAQYLRTTENQQYSLENESGAIQKYAASHGFEVVRTYSDAAKSGIIRRKRRHGLRQLLQDVAAGIAPYRTSHSVFWEVQSSITDFRAKGGMI
jgi:resolvase-like protein